MNFEKWVVWIPKKDISLFNYILKKKIYFYAPLKYFRNYNSKKEMSKQFFPSLSQNYIEILEDDEYYDITIEVGEDPNVKIFRAHMIILYYRSPFFRRTLASNKKNDDGVLAHIKLSNISPEIFQII